MPSFIMTENLKYCRQYGLSLLFLIFVLLALGFLALAVSSMFSDSMQYHIASHQSLQAIYNSESGYRIFAERIANADNQSQRDAVLPQVHGKSFIFSSNMGQADIDIQSFFYNATLSGSTITATALGRIPDTVPPGSASVMLYDAIHSPANCSLISKSDTSITLNLDSGFLNSGLIFPAARVSTNLSGESMNLASYPSSCLFPQSFGVFRFCNCTGGQKGSDVFTYKYLTNNNLTGVKNITSPGSTSESGNYDCIFMDRFAVISSTGRYGSGNMAVSHKNVYNKMLGFVGDSSEEEIGEFSEDNVPGVDLQGLLDGTFEDGNSLGEFETVGINGDDAIHVSDTTAESGNQPRTEAYLGLESDTGNPFYDYWSDTGFLSYEAQVKIALGDPDDGFANPPSIYMAGLLLRGTGTTTGSTTSYGVSFVRSRTGSGQAADGIPDSIVPTGQEEVPMIVFWDRSGRGNNDAVWLAYSSIDSADSVLNGNGLKPWSTLLVRIIEAPSVDVTDASAITKGDDIAVDGANATVIRKIGLQSGASTLLLTNLSGIFSSGDSIGDGYITRFSQRDNYIWVMYSDTNNHGTPNNSPLDYVNRRGIARADYSWPISKIEDWNATEDYFTLIQWNSIHTSEDSSLKKLGTGKELNCVLRTNKYNTSPSEWEDDRWELGINTLGDSSTITYFDDFGGRVFITSGGGANSGYIPPIVSY